jgi:hypothetical protein
MVQRLNTNSRIQMDIIRDKIEAAAHAGTSANG